MEFNLQHLTDIIILTASVIGALYTIYAKLILPGTKLGKKIADKKENKQKKELKNTIIETTKSFIEPLTGDLKQIQRDIKEISNQNTEQSKNIEKLDKKINSNEIDRIRWEVFSFARLCRLGKIPSHEEFKHIFKLHDKYEQLISLNSVTNGQMDVEFQFITQYYLKICELENNIEK